MDLSLSHSSFQFSTELHGKLSVPTFVCNETIHCTSCTSSVSHLLGIICASFGYRQGHWSPCKMAAHEHCYRVPLEVDPFPKGLTSRDNDEAVDGDNTGPFIEWEVTEKEQIKLEAMYVCARPGDHLITLFQCKLCHFRNLYKREPQPEAAEDKWALVCMVRANIEAFWSRCLSTVGNNLGEMQRIKRIANSLCIDNPFSTFSCRSFPLADTFGMAAAMISLQRSLDKGKNSKTIQWDTMRGVQSSFSHYAHTTPQGTGGFTMTDSKRSTHITSSATNTMWFKQFMDGSHECMGDVKVQDTAITVDVLLGLQVLLESSWKEAEEARDANTVFELATLGAIVTSGFSAGLHGEEIGHIRLNETIVLTTQGLKQNRRPHIVLGLEARFKGQVARKKHCIPLVRETKLGIQNQTWLLRLLKCYKRQNILFGPLICFTTKDQTPASIWQMHMIFHKCLLSLQERQPHLFGKGFDVVNKYSVHCSLRRGSTAQARNAKVPKDVILVNN
ncbi:hypothetical protein ACA910_008798 [Epithemia clementina (nom. ined.)]